MAETFPQEIAQYFIPGLTPIPLKLCSKKPLVGSHDWWNPKPVDLKRWAPKSHVHSCVCCGTELAVLGFDTLGPLEIFPEPYPEEASWPEYFAIWAECHERGR